MSDALMLPTHPPGGDAAPKVRLEPPQRWILRRTGWEAALLGLLLTAVGAVLIWVEATAWHNDCAALFTYLGWLMSMFLAPCHYIFAVDRRVWVPFAQRATTAVRGLEIRVRRTTVSEDGTKVTFQVEIELDQGIRRTTFKLPMAGVVWIGCSPGSRGRKTLELLDISYQRDGERLALVPGDRGIVRRAPAERD